MTTSQWAGAGWLSADADTAARLGGNPQVAGGRGRYHWMSKPLSCKAGKTGTRRPGGGTWRSK